MKRKKSILKISGILIVLAVMAWFILTGCWTQKETAVESATSQTATETVTTQTSETSQLSEQPDSARFKEYFTDLYLAKLPLGEQVGPSNTTKTTVFTSQDQFCTVGMLIKDIPAGSLASAVYDTVAKKDIQPKAAFPMELNKGGFAGAAPLNYPPGKYEYKVYIDDVLVAVLPFEVK